MRFLPFSRRRWTATGSPVEDRAHAAPHDEGAEPFTPERQLIDETEAFLRGTLAELLAGQLRSLPPWLLVNRLAHGDVDVLRRLVRGELPPLTIAAAHPGYGRAWMLAERLLVLRLLRSAGGPEEIRRVQRDVLVPVELELVRRSDTESLTLGAIVAGATAALDHHHLDH
jgi:hypothetical protein